MINGTTENCVLFFVKHPASGRVKTRLAEQIGRDVATDLYKSFVVDILTTLHSISVNFKIVFYPPDAEKKFQQWLGQEYSYVSQSGMDLGQRMKNAFLQAFNDGFDKVVLIGSDLPDLPAEYLELGFKALETNDVVLGPSSDGGYYLIGFAKEAFLPDVFEPITWSSADVLEQTLNILKKHEHRVYLLPQWHDVDTLTDLSSLVRRNKNTAFQKSATICYLKDGKLVDEFDV
ncbi:MAG: TIGR04282 family arsenosugar biosynthesis glycosyltransferase [Planctomycetota bacterium]|jgi:rSAM/selenodomain-associated transferase 1